jgi:hypothetical protein
MSCSLDTTGKGNFKNINVVTDVPGTNGRSNSANKDFVSWIAFSYFETFLTE